MLAQQTTCSVCLEDSDGVTITYVQGVFCGAAVALVWVCTKMYVTAENIFEGSILFVTLNVGTSAVLEINWLCEFEFCLYVKVKKKKSFPYTH